MLAYWERDCEWMGDGLQLAICPSFTGPTSLAAIDVSGRSNPGTLINMDRNTAWVTSGGKGALSFDGSSSQVDLAVAVPLSTVHTTSAWIFPRGQSTSFNFGGLCGQPSSLGNNQTASLYVSGPNSTAINAFGYSHVDALVTASGLTLENRWSLITSVRIGTRVDLHLNGSFQTTGNLAQNGTFSPTVLGRRLDFAAFYNGALDDFRLYNRALTAPEIRQLYERDRAGGMLHQPPSQRSYSAQLAAAFSILAESGSYALTGQPIPLLYGRVLPADTASVLLSGQTTPLLTSRLLSADQGAYAYTGTDAATLLGRLLDAGAAAYTLDGNAAGFLASRRISADTVAYLASGLDAGFLRGRVLEAGTGQYVLVASPVNLQTGTPGAGGAAPYYYLFLLGGSR